MKEVRLEKWGTLVSYCCKEHGIGPALGGLMYDNPEVPDGSKRVTGYIEEIDVENRRARAGNTWFKLGEVDPEMLAMLRAGAPPISMPDPTITNETAVTAIKKNLEMGKKYFKPKIDPSLN